MIPDKKRKLKPVKKVTTIRIALDLFERLAKEADQEGRSINNLIERKLSAA